MKTKEKVLKEEIRKQRMGEVDRYPFDEFWFSAGFDTGWDKSLAEVGKIIDDIEVNIDDGFHPKEKHCNSQELKQKLGI